MSMPLSRMTSTTRGFRTPGSSPALSASNLPSPKRFRYASAIWLRALLCTQTNNTLIGFMTVNQIFSAMRILLILRFRSPVIHHLDLFDRQQAAAHHWIEHRQELLDFFLAVHDFDDERQIHRKPENLGGVQPARFAEAHRTAQHGRAREMHCARLEHDGFIEWLVVPAVAFADENAQQNG